MNASIVQINSYEWMPYKVPTDVNKQAEYFAKILSVPKSYLKLATDELNNKLKKHEVITKLFGLAGIKTAQDLVKDFKSLKNSKPYSIILSVILTANEIMKKDTNNELKHRQKISDYEFK